MTYVLGVVAALAAPLVMTTGFFIWDGLWQGSSLGLNIFKGVLASSIFLLVIGILNLSTGATYLSHSGTATDVSWILFSGFTGITIGDTCWLQALTMIGARRVIIVDVTKPFVAALIGYIGLNEPLTPLLFVGLGLTMGGVGIVSFEQTSKPKAGEEEEKEKEKEKDIKQADKQEEEDNDQGADQATTTTQDSIMVSMSTTAATTKPPPPRTCCGRCTSNRLAVGYVFACFNVLFDVVGSFLTRKFGEGLTTFDINAIRFGSSAATLVLLSGLPLLCSCVARDSTVGHGLYGKMNWTTAMSRKSWMYVSLGVLFVTVACPALSQWALFQLPLGVCLCLTSVGPLFAIPMSAVFKKEKITVRTVVGSVLAIVGVVVLQFTRG